MPIAKIVRAFLLFAAAVPAQSPVGGNQPRSRTVSYCSGRNARRNGMERETGIEPATNSLEG